MGMRKNSILILNVNPGYLPKTFVECLAHSYRALPHLQPIQMGTSAMINLARTTNGKAFLESDAEWALLIDSDMTWTPESIIRLSKTAKEKKAKVVSGLTFMQQRGRVVPHAYSHIPSSRGDGDTVLAPYAVLPALDQPFTVKAVGGACLLVHRDVYEDVRKNTQGTTAYYWQEERYSERNDNQVGEDLVFCERIREAGYEIWYEPRSVWPHMQKPDILGIADYISFLDENGIPHPYGGVLSKSA